MTDIHDTARSRYCGYVRTIRGLVVEEDGVRTVDEPHLECKCIRPPHHEGGHRFGPWYAPSDPERAIILNDLGR